jgi:phosphatidylinositol kinase/protein kinase (PI-3  family)
LIDSAGHLVHIDFGFMLSNSPGALGFELAPFKFPQEYVDILGGLGSEHFAELKRLMCAAFLALRKHAEKIVILIEMMSQGFLSFGPLLAVKTEKHRL